MAESPLLQHSGLAWTHRPGSSLSGRARRGAVTHVRDGLLGLLLGIPALLHCLLHFALKLGQVCLHLLLLVDEAGVLDKGKENC